MILILFFFYINILQVISQSSDCSILYNLLEKNQLTNLFEGKSVSECCSLKSIECSGGSITSM